MAAAVIHQFRSGWGCPSVVVLSYQDCSLPLLPTSNPHVRGQLWKSGATLLISTG